MSRHRNVRSMNVDDEYYDEDDVYGHSVDDNYCISPSTAAQFTYNRDRGCSELASYLSEERIPEEIESDEEGSQTLRNPGGVDITALSDVDKARLSSCLDEIHNVLGESVEARHLTHVILRHHFNIETALDELLSTQESKVTNKIQPTSSVQDLKPSQKLQGDSRNTNKETFNVKNYVPPNKNDVANGVTSKLSAVTIVAGKGSVKGFRLENSEEMNSKGDAVDLQTLGEKDMALARELVGEPVLVNARPDIDKALPPTPKLTPSKSRMSVEKMKEEYTKRLDGKDLINLVVIGHVDAGKSTLMGHLLYQIGNVNKRSMHKYEQESQKAGKSSFMYAWVLDETDEERSRGVTMDVAHTSFETDHKLVTLLDAPGHKDFIPNMITGTAQAETAVLVINATRGEFETGFEAGGQTREHSLLARSLGVSQIIVAVNKMDTVGWAQSRYAEITQKISQFLRQIGFKDSVLAYVPCSGLSGENLTKPVKEVNLVSWYKGPTLLQQIDKFRRVERHIDKTLRLCVSDVYKGLTSGFMVAGNIVSGVLQSADRLLVMPAGEMAVVKAVMVDEVQTLCSFAGDHVSLSLTGIDPNHVTVGSVLCDPTNPIVATTRFRARVVIFNITVPITKGFPVIFHYQSLSEPAIIKSLLSQLSKSTGQVLKHRPKCLLKNSNAVIEIALERPVCIEVFRDFKDLGRFMLRSNGATIAAGLVEQVTVGRPS